ncbi:hypothetical protein JUN65_01885 [Gluconacetobacter azotocaptans]|uniref:hypothetical protein n=1 Tax=Gluconacetobacter azotocaptans TaxID=142834 RepID=UPI00195B54C3|nr:hypothetical protein [Gluconacetobacter azotocaptans]MBM9400343.1 hypothetical protein [Gluconacetobacter azotocaptans]
MSDPLRRHFMVAVSEGHMVGLLMLGSDVWKFPVNDEDVVEVGDYLFVRLLPLDRGGAVGVIMEITHVEDVSVWVDIGCNLTRRASVRVRRVL